MIVTIGVKKHTWQMRVIDLQRVCSVVGQMERNCLPISPERSWRKKSKVHYLPCFKSITPRKLVGEMNIRISRWDFGGACVCVVLLGSSLKSKTSSGLTLRWFIFLALAWDRCTWPPLSKGPGHFERHFDRSSAGWTQVAFLLILSEFVRKKNPVRTGPAPFRREIS